MTLSEAEARGFTAHVVSDRPPGRKDSTMKLTAADKKMLLEWGHPESDFRQIEEALQKSKNEVQAGFYADFPRRSH